MSLRFGSDLVHILGSDLVQIWSRRGSHLAQVWFIFDSGLVQICIRCGIYLVQIWFVFGSDLVQIWFVLGSLSWVGLRQVWPASLVVQALVQLWVGFQS